MNYRALVLLLAMLLTAKYVYDRLLWKGYL
jgi:hypothetical protein